MVSAVSASPVSISCAAVSNTLTPVAQAWATVGPPIPGAPIIPDSQGIP